MSNETIIRILFFTGLGFLGVGAVVALTGNFSLGFPLQIVGLPFYAVGKIAQFRRMRR